jgi:hypothetical protein
VLIAFGTNAGVVVHGRSADGFRLLAAHPAVTAITASTSRPRNRADNLGGGMGRLPDEAMRRRMIQLVDSLPTA